MRTALRISAYASSRPHRDVRGVVRTSALARTEDGRGGVLVDAVGGRISEDIARRVRALVDELDGATRA
jgi:hypothetical protein